MAASMSALEAGDKHQAEQAAIQAWMANGMKGPPPANAGEIEQPVKRVVGDSAKISLEGAKLVPQPLIRAGKLAGDLCK